MRDLSLCWLVLAVSLGACEQPARKQVDQAKAAATESTKNMLLSSDQSVRGGTVTPEVGTARGGAVGAPKKSFGAKLGDGGQ